MKILALAAAAMLSACTYANVSATPVALANGTEAYRYTGRANFNHQMAEADNVMAQTCAQFGKRPVIIDQGTRAIGAGAMLNGPFVNAQVNTQQDILFQCR
jgi:hypothetical protein